MESLLEDVFISGHRARHSHSPHCPAAKINDTTGSYMEVYIYDLDDARRATFYIFASSIACFIKFTYFNESHELAMPQPSFRRPYAPSEHEHDAYVPTIFGYATEPSVFDDTLKRRWLAMMMLERADMPLSTVHMNIFNFVDFISLWFWAARMTCTAPSSATWFGEAPARSHTIQYFLDGSASGTHVTSHKDGWLISRAADDILFRGLMQPIIKKEVLIISRNGRLFSYHECLLPQYDDWWWCDISTLFLWLWKLSDARRNVLNRLSLHFIIKNANIHWFFYRFARSELSLLLPQLMPCKIPLRAHIDRLWWWRYRCYELFDIISPPRRGESVI